MNGISLFFLGITIGLTVAELLSDTHQKRPIKNAMTLKAAAAASALVFLAIYILSS